MRYKLSTIFCLVAVLCAVFALPQPGRSATYTREYTISSSTDDADEQTSGQVQNNAEDLDLEVGYLVGVRFQGVQVPQGATILSAYIEFTAQDPDIGSYRVTIKGEASDNPLAFEEVDFNISNRDKTSATVTWSDSTSWVTGDQYQTPDIKSIVQEIVNRLGWVKGNSMVFLLKGEEDERDAETFEHNQANAALLHIAAECPKPSSVPLGAIKHAAPANIMFMLDDSGSMDWEFLTEENDGKFQNYQYVFNDPGDNVFGNNSVISEIDRKKWKSQWSGYNKLYYDPSVDYAPWPTLDNAHPDSPKSHPVNGTSTFALNDTYYLFDHGIIIDDLDDGFSKTEEPWTAVLNHHESYDNHFWECSSDATLHTATWTPNLVAGDYNVYAWWRSYGDYSTAVPYAINHLGGPTTVHVDQTQNEKQWNRLGATTYTFDGTTDKVEISYTPSGSTDLVCADAVKFVSTGATIIDIKNAHYYTFDDANASGVYDAGDTVYLVVIDWTGATYNIRYYAATVTGSGATEEVTDLVEVTGPSIPASVESTRTPAEERQNFANWYSFYRRRALTAAAAVANAIVNMQGVNVGLYSINGNLKQPVLKVKAQGEDESATLLNKLYGLTISDQISPLRQGLEDVGKYFDESQSSDIGSSPWASAAGGGACQQAFAIVMSTGYWNGSYSGVGNADGDNGAPYADSYSNTLADVAMYYYENDLATSLEDSVTTNPADNNPKQHMVTYTVGFGLSGTLIPAEYDLEGGSYPTWPNPADGNEQKIDDLWHAAVNGRGEYLSVFNSGGLVDSLLAVKKSIESRIGSAAPVSVNGVELYEEVGPKLYMFQSAYNSYGWTGDVKAYEVTPTTGEVSETPEWSAADELDSMDWTNRRIATYNPDTASGIPFQYNTTILTDTQKTQLYSDSTIVDFLRGNRSLEKLNGGTFRNRFSVLGDIVHSSPVFENGVLYTGANDGMLHAFSQTDGSEIFAYVPNLVFENLTNLAAPTYYWNHTYYVDLSPVIQRRVEVSTGNEITLLVGGLGRGGKGYYALNITGIDESTSFNSDADVAGKVMWEFGGDDDLGYSYTRPAIVDSNDDNLNANGTGWMVIAGNGYNSENGRAVLLIFDPSNGQLLKRIDTGVGSCNGLSTPVVIDVDDNDRVDYVYAGDLKGNLWKFDLTNSDYNKWGVAYGTDSNANDSINYSEGDDPKPLFQALDQPITTKPDVMRHPERHGYIVVFGTGKYLASTDYKDHSVNTIYGIWDYGDDDDDSEYLGSLTDRDTGELSYPTGTFLLKQEIVLSSEDDPNFWTVTVDSEELKLRVLTNNQPNWETVDDDDTDELPNPGSIADPPNTVHAGWYFDLPLTGERVVTDVMIRDAKAIVTTFTPEEAPCSIGGDSIVHEMDAASGGRLLRAQFDIGGAAAIDSEDLIDIGEAFKVAPTGIQKTGRLHLPAILGMGSTEMKYFSSSEGTIKRVREIPPKVGVRHWRELE